MPDISKITLPSGTTYDIKDTVARAAAAGTAHWLGVTTTALTDGASTNPITINGDSVTATNGDIAAYGDSEFIFNGSIWQEFGSTGSLGALAFKDSASGTFTPSGSVSKPNVTVTESTATVNSITDVGSLPSFTATVANETLTLGFSAGTLPTQGSAQTVLTGATAALDSAPTFTGSQGSVTVS